MPDGSVLALHRCRRDVRTSGTCTYRRRSGRAQEAGRPHRRDRQPRQAARQKEAQLQQALIRRTGKPTEAGPAGRVQ
jgi:hypothetical protein